MQIRNSRKVRPSGRAGTLTALTTFVSAGNNVTALNRLMAKKNSAQKGAVARVSLSQSLTSSNISCRTEISQAQDSGACGYSSESKRGHAQDGVLCVSNIDTMARHEVGLSHVQI